MGEFSTQQFLGAFVSPFIFRIPPVGFFVGFGPVGVIFSPAKQYDDQADLRE